MEMPKYTLQPDRAWDVIREVLSDPMTPNSFHSHAGFSASAVLRDQRVRLTGLGFGVGHVVCSSVYTHVCRERGRERKREREREAGNRALRFRLGVEGAGFWAQGSGCRVLGFRSLVEQSGLRCVGISC